MQHRIVQLGPDQGPEEYLQALTRQLGGAWQVEGALDTWRAELGAGGVIRSLGLSRGVDGWVLAWRVDPEVPDSAALGVVVAAVLFSVLALALFRPLGGWALLASGVTLLGSLRLGRWMVQSRLPDTSAAAEDLARSLAQVA